MRTAESWKGVAVLARHLHKSSSDLSLPWRLRWKPVCASTELAMTDWLKEDPFSLNSFPRALFAERQNNGFGQRGRVWSSPRGGVWVSAALPLMKQTTFSPEIFGLAGAVALAERMESFGVPVRIKWPNDLIVLEKKIAGFLPRLVHRGRRIIYVRMGIGLNVCNQVPPEGIALKTLLRLSQCKPAFWGSEVLRVLERTVELMRTPKIVSASAGRRLWTNSIRDPYSKELWQVEGIGLDGALKLRQTSKTTEWRRWSEI